MTRDMTRRTFLQGAAVAGAGFVLLPRLARADGPPAGGQWLVGDLHCHTVFSHDVWGGPDDDNTGPEDAYTFGWTAGEQITNAKTRGLDYLAITDHNDVRALSTPEYLAATGITLIRGYEHSLGGGHAGCLGVDSVQSTAGPNSDAQNVADAVRAQGGLFILNHPSYDKGWRYGTIVVPDSVEVWNISWPYRHVENTTVPPSPAVSDNYKSLPFWEAFLASRKMPANGGSDNHYRGTFAVQGVGQPSTWVYAADRSPASIMDAIRNGRTTVSAEPPLLGGARVELTAGANDDWMVGDTAPRGSVVRARVLNAPAHTLVFIEDGGARTEVPITSIDQTVELASTATNRVRVEVYANEGYWMAALSSAIYFA